MISKQQITQTVRNRKPKQSHKKESRSTGFGFCVVWCFVMSWLQKKVSSDWIANFVVNLVGGMHHGLLNLRNRLTGGFACYVSSVVAEISSCPPQIPTFSIRGVQLWLARGGLARSCISLPLDGTLWLALAKGLWATMVCFASGPSWLTRWAHLPHAPAHPWFDCWMQRTSSS